MVIIHSFEIIKTIHSNKSTHTREKTHDKVKKKTPEDRLAQPRRKRPAITFITMLQYMYITHGNGPTNVHNTTHSNWQASILGSMLNAAQARRCCMCVVFSTPPQNNSMANYVCNLCKLCSILN